MASINPAFVAAILIGVPFVTLVLWLSRKPGPDDEACAPTDREDH